MSPPLLPTSSSKLRIFASRTPEKDPYPGSSPTFSAPLKLVKLLATVVFASYVSYLLLSSIFPHPSILTMTPTSSSPNQLGLTLELNLTSPSPLTLSTSSPHNPESKEEDEFHPPILVNQEPQLTATITNPNSFPVTLLTWDTPLDPKASSLGVFRLYKLPPSSSSAAANEIPLRTLFFRRLLPPTRESDLIEIPAGGSVKAEHALREVAEKLREPGRYLVKAEGEYRAVWMGMGKQEVSEESLGALSGEEVSQGGFEGELEFEVVRE
ncbi:hypothetical protein BDZ91DRAFT_549730 [Kalaharituber pfeilii]|nr:hypothetical protein BDZ91DRAFT_549730 [Kalaharituber pfeilii]